MEDFDKIFWGFVFSISGIAFGWTLNQLSQWFRSKQEEKQKLKVILFNLLEAYFLFVRSDFDKYIKKITDKVHSKIPMEEQSEEVKKFMNNLYSSLVHSHLKPDLIKELKSVQTNYQDSIKTLASIDPITAYYLSGKTNIIESFELIQNMFESLTNQYPNEQGELKKGANMAMKVLKPDIFNETLTELEKEIKKIAFKINPYEWYRSTIAIRRLNRNVNENLDKEIDKLFEKLNPMFENLK